ncbi:hypothetical protein ACFQY4_26765 [Catellatospora bangladeshensis]|uniref:hypothetical protein n=1 Tax=Catellatospora bangladeshensis TaxID=310355 RepID=UPI00361DE628
MATIVIYPQADLAAVEAVLDGLARRVDGQWLVEAGPLFVMVFAGSRLTPGDGFDPAELTRLATGLGRPVTCAVCVEIPAGAGDAAREFTVGVLSACGGRAEDEASGHLWSLSEITERLQVGHLRFYDRGRYGEYRVPFAVPAEHVRYAAVADADDIVRGHRDGWLSAADATRLAFLRRCDMTDRRPEFGLLERVTPGTGEYEQVAATIVDRWGSSSRSGSTPPPAGATPSLPASETVSCASSPTRPAAPIWSTSQPTRTGTARPGLPAGASSSCSAPSPTATA